jgi:glycosyltransferase involved in cell wall biosynthesis
MINLVFLHCNIRTGHFGIGSHSRTLVNELKKYTQYSISIIILDSQNVELFDYRLEDAVDVFEIPRPQNGLFFNGHNNEIQETYAARIVDIVYPYFSKKENLIFLSNTSNHAIPCLRLSKEFNAKSVYIHHSFSWKMYLKCSYETFALEWERQNYVFAPEAFEVTNIELELALNVDKVITVTHLANVFFSEVLGIPNNKIFTIYNGILPVELSTIKPSLLRNKYGFSEVDKIVLFCGRIVDEKGLEYLLEAFNLLLPQIPNLRLIVVGDGEYGKYLRKISHHWSKITWTGPVDKNIISDLYTISDVGVIPSVTEQCSICSIEMRFHRLPIVVSAIEGLDELFIDGFDALKVPARYDEDNIVFFDPIDFADRIKILLENRELANRLAINSHRKGIQVFSAEKMVKEYDGIFERLFLTFL